MCVCVGGREERWSKVGVCVCVCVCVCVGGREEGWSKVGVCVCVCGGGMILPLALGTE